MAKTLAQIQASLEPYYAADRNLLNTQLNALPGATEAEIKGLDAKLGQANDNILQSARGRGLGFSGIPIQEQAQYAATEYAPAVARVKQSQIERQTGILGSLNSLARDQRTQAQSIYDSDRNFAEQQRQFNLNMKLQRDQMAAQERASRAATASAGASAGDYLGALMGGGGGAAAPSTQAQMSQRKGGGFNFNIGGKSVSAATYAKATGTSFRSLLQQMAKAGDKGAKAALGFVGNDFKYDPRKLTAQNASLYNALVWGLAPKATYKAPAKTQSTAQALRNASTGVWS